MGLDMFVIDKEGDEKMYWRKANQIHKFFVDNLQQGVDECQVSDQITKEVLEDLKGKIELIKEDNSLAEELLPNSPGFFFGSYDYDEWYFEKLETTLKWVDETIENWNEKEELYYQSSW